MSVWAEEGHFCVMIDVVDDRGFPFHFDSPPQRIVSLVPSLTETLVDLGLEDQIVGVTRFCIHPDHLRREKTRVGGTKGVRLDLIMDLKPDLVIANLEENEAQDVMALEIAGVPCWVCDVRSVERAFSLLTDLGALVGRAREGAEMEQKARATWESTRAQCDPGKNKLAAYAVWRAPWMWAGRDAYIQSVLNWWGWRTWPDAHRYPELSMSDVVAASVEEVLLPSEPFPFKEAHREECEGLPSRLVDGEIFSWYGSRMLRVPAHFLALDAAESR